MRFARDCFVVEHLRLASDARTAEHRSAGRRPRGIVPDAWEDLHSGTTATDDVGVGERRGLRPS